jgi:hypothetical protein
MNRLLSPEQIQEAMHLKWTPDWTLDKAHQALCAAQDAQTAKAILEWLNEMHYKHDTTWFNVYDTVRRNLQQWLEAQK